MSTLEGVLKHQFFEQAGCGIESLQRTAFDKPKSGLYFLCAIRHLTATSPLHPNKFKFVHSSYYNSDLYNTCSIFVVLSNGNPRYTDCARRLQRTGVDQLEYLDKRREDWISTVPNREQQEAKVEDHAGLDIIGT